MQLSPHRYSTDEGKTWKTFNFTTVPVKIHGVLTEPGETTTQLFLFGSLVLQHSWQVFALNMSMIFGKFVSCLAVRVRLEHTLL